MKNELKSKPKSLVVCGSYTIGKERVFIAVAELLNLKIFVTKEKKGIIDCLEDERLNKMITEDPYETNLHVVQMGKLNIKDLDAHLSKFSGYDSVIG